MGIFGTLALMLVLVLVLVLVPKFWVPDSPHKRLL